MTTTAIDYFLKQPVWAVIGVSTDQHKFGYKVYKHLKKLGYTVYAVNPKLREIEGCPCYPTLESLPGKPAVVSFVVPPEVTEQLVPECIKLGIRHLWIQPGAESKKAIQQAEDFGIEVIHHRCVLQEAHEMI